VGRRESATITFCQLSLQASNKHNRRSATGSHQQPRYQIKLRQQLENRAGWSGLPQARNTPGTKTTRCRHSYCLLPFVCISWDLVIPKPAMASPPSCEDEPHGSERPLVAPPYLVPFVLSISSWTASWQGFCITKIPCSDQTQSKPLLTEVFPVDNSTERSVLSLDLILFKNSGFRIPAFSFLLLIYVSISNY
jgi:hypothetical protein